MSFHHTPQLTVAAYCSSSLGEQNPDVKDMSIYKDPSKRHVFSRLILLVQIWSFQSETN